MLSMSKNFFKIEQPGLDTAPRNPKPLTMSEKSHGNDYTLQCTTGECIQEVAHVKKSSSSRDGGGYIPGTLYCTNLRVAFVPYSSPDTQNCSCCLFMHSDNDVALPCIGKLVAVNSFMKTKVVTSTSILKFVPEELIIYCRDFRVLRFQFHDNGLEPQAFRMTMAIAQAQKNNSRNCCFKGVAPKKLENSYLSRDDKKPFPVLMFETLYDWEKELKRFGAANWRVSPVNEHFDMSTSLPKYLWVPRQFLDNELKRMFVYFNERRIPRLCWHHSNGSDLLRAANFHINSDPQKEDMRAIETLLFAGHSQCVIIGATVDLPCLAEIQQSYSKLWNLSLCLADSLSDEKWLSSLESTHWLDHVRVCLKKANEVAILLTERSRSVVLQESDDRDLNCLLASLVQVLSDPHMRTICGFQSLIQKEWVAAGHCFLQRLNVLQKNDQDESPVFFLFLDSIWQLLQQFPQSFEFTEAYLLAIHDSCFIPFSSTFLFNSQWERGRMNQNCFLNQLYTPVNGWQENLCLEILQKGGFAVKKTEHAHLPTIWDWLLRSSSQQAAQFRNPWYSENTFSNGGTWNKNFLPTNNDKIENSSSEKWSLYLFSEGSLISQTNIFPWKNGPLSKKSFRRGQMLESSGDQDRSWKIKCWGSLDYHDGLLLLPSYFGTSIHLWKRCYLRGNPEVQVGLFASSIVSLSEELDLLQERMSYLEATGS